MQISETKLPGLMLIEPRVYHDNRGFFSEIFQVERYQQRGIRQTFVQDNISYSSRYVLRGLHYQLRHPQAKLVTVLRGAVLDVVVDLRKGSPTFGQSLVLELNAQNRYQLYIPAGFAHGFLALSESVDFLYKCTDYYHPGDEYGIFWKDPQLNISWNVESPIVSEKDQKLPLLKNIPEEHFPIYSSIV